MKMHTAIRHGEPLQARAPLPLRWMPWLVFAIIVAWITHLAWPVGAAGQGGLDAATTSMAPSLVHWKSAQHDWLLVVDPATHELVVYDANDGRPLRRLGAASGAGSIDSIRADGNRLIVASHQRPRLQILSLPSLTPVTLAAR